MGFLRRLNLIIFSSFFIISILFWGAQIASALDSYESCIRSTKYNLQGGGNMLIARDGKLFYGNKWEVENLEQRRRTCKKIIAMLDVEQDCSMTQREATPEEYNSTLQNACSSYNNENSEALIYVGMLFGSIFGYIFLVNGVLRWLFTSRFSLRF